MDGFDELSTEDENNKFFAILKTVENLQNNTIIITSRKVKLIDTHFIPYSKWEVSDFTLKQITNFFQKWFKDKNEQLVSDLKDHDLLDKLPNTPLVMTLIAVLFETDENVEIPANLSELYKMFTELLIGRWNLDRRIDTFYKANDKETFLTDLAVFLHNNNSVSCAENELFHVFDMTAKKLGRKFDYKLLLDEIIKDTNLLIQNEKNEYEFRHLSFQEYFVGVHLTIKNDIDDIVRVFPHPWWDQVLYFYCGTRKVNDDVLPKIYEKILTCSNREKILGIFEIGYLIQSSYKTDAKIRSELLLRSLMDYSLIIPGYIDELLDERKNIPEIIFYLSFMEAFKMHFSSNYLQEIYVSIYENIKDSTFDTFEKAMALFLLTAIIASHGDVDIFGRL
jgi:predicted NACHT family NTPase